MYINDSMLHSYIFYEPKYTHKIFEHQQQQENFSCLVCVYAISMAAFHSKQTASVALNAYSKLIHTESIEFQCACRRTQL